MKFMYAISWFYLICIILILAKEERVFDEYVDIGNSLIEHTESNFQKYESPVVDYLKDDDDGVFELADIMSLSELGVDIDMDTYSSSEKLVFKDVHNIYRSNLTKPIPKGSDVEYVEWNNTLEWAANDWLKQCIFSNGYGKQDNMTDKQGQNIYKGTSMLPSRPSYLWYEEYRNFFFNNFTCKKWLLPFQCGHMTQMLWADSSNIGCARRSHCFPTESDDKIVNCHYLNIGNNWSPGNQIFKYGLQCTRCELSDGNLCFGGLCVDKRICSAYKLDCKCKLDCKNCVKPNPKTCRCESCKSGWDGRDCSFPCVNLIDIHKKSPGFCWWKIKTEAYKNLCSHTDFSRACRKGCAFCKQLNNKEKNCCGGKMCPLYYVLDKNCNCKIDCPSNLCLYGSSKSTSIKYPKTRKPISNITEKSLNKTKVKPKTKLVKASKASRVTATVIYITLIWFTVSKLLPLNFVK